VKKNKCKYDAETHQWYTSDEKSPMIHDFSKQNIKPESIATELSNDQNYFMDYYDDDNDNDDQNYFMDYSKNNVEQFKVDSCTLVDFIEDHHFSDYF
jgi:hypothetical protein